MHVTGMTISRIPPFARTVEFKFDERVNLFIGPNGSGKSTALRMLQGRTTLDGRFDFQLSKDWQQSSQVPWMAARARGTVRLSSGPAQKEGSDIVPWMYVPAPRLSLPLSGDTDAMHPLQSPGTTMVYDGEEIEPNPIRELHYFLSKYHFDGIIIQKYCKMITDLFRTNKSRSNAIARHQSVTKVAYECSQSICHDILSPNNAPSNYMHGQVVGHDFAVTSILDYMGITHTGTSGSLIFAGDLSAGTQTTLLWIWYLAIEMADFYRNCADWSTKPAILLIDEIENHLHPTWQRRVIPALLKHFPGLQIFATTHSPFVVAGLRSGQVHLLNRDAGGVITASSNDRDIIGWTADQILRTFMGVDEPTDQLTVDRSNRLRELHGKASLTSEEEAELNDLRRQVGESFPLNPVDPQLDAQRERYADMMERFLRSRMPDAAPDSGEA